MTQDILNTIIYRNPNIIITPINSDFFSVVNPFIDYGLKVINKEQLNILNSIQTSGETIDSLMKRTNQTEDIILVLMKILSEKLFVSEENKFSLPTWKKKPKALNLWIQTTNDCNLRCSYCYIHTLGQHECLSEEVMEAFTKNLIQTVEINNLKLVQLRFAGGEPLLKFSLLQKIIPYLRIELKKVNCELKVAFLSNAVALNDEIMEFMKRNAVGIGVSIDGLHEYQNATRHFKNGKGTFDIVERNIERLKQNGFRPSIMAVISNSNLDGLEDFTKYVIDSQLHTRYSFVSGTEIDIEKLIDKLYRCYDIFEEAIKDGYEFSRLHQLCDLKFDNLFFQTCSDGYNGGALYTNGDIYFCQRHFGTEEPLGSIYEQSDMLSIIRRKTYYEEVSEECKSCVYRYICTSGCPIERINGQDPHCAVYKKMIPIIFKLRGEEHLYNYKKNIKCNKVI